MSGQIGFRLPLQCNGKANCSRTEQAARMINVRTFTTAKTIRGFVSSGSFLLTIYRRARSVPVDCQQEGAA